MKVASMIRRYTIEWICWW